MDNYKGNQLKARRNIWYKLSVMVLGMLAFVTVKAQQLADIIPPKTQQTVDMATGMRSNGKIYVVVAVLCMILAGLFIYLFSLDRKIGKLEKEG